MISVMLHSDFWAGYLITQLWLLGKRTGTGGRLVSLTPACPARSECGESLDLRLV